MTRKRRAWACLLHGIVSFPFEQQVVVFVFACPSPFIHAKEKGQEAEETEEAEQIKKNRGRRNIVSWFNQVAWVARGLRL